MISSTIASSCMRNDGEPFQGKGTLLFSIRDRAGGGAGGGGGGGGLSSPTFVLQKIEIN